MDGLRAEACDNRVSPIEAAAEPDQGETCGMGGVSWPDISFAVEGELFALEEVSRRKRSARSQTEPEITQGIDQKHQQRASKLYEMVG